MLLNTTAIGVRRYVGEVIEEGDFAEVREDLAALEENYDEVSGGSGSDEVRPPQEPLKMFHFVPHSI